jgi:HD-GYP domain-containing protein (c-di-GMP phosphodiesterase class II)
MSREQACIEIARHSGTQFDPDVVEAFLVMIRRSPEGVYEEQEPFVQHDHETHEKAAAVGSDVA